MRRSDHPSSRRRTHHRRDRVAADELRRLLDTDGGAVAGLLDQIAQGWPAVAADIREGVGLTTIKDRVVDNMDEDEERGLLPPLDALAASEEPMS